MQDFRNLKVWQRSHDLTLAVYEVTKCFPKDEVYGLTSQMRRAAASIPSNIAEGCGRGSDADLKRFLYMSMGSASELQYQVLLARDLSYVLEPDYASVTVRVQEVKRMLASFIARLKADS